MSMILPRLAFNITVMVRLCAAAWRHAFAVDQLDVGQLDKACRAHQRQNDADSHGFCNQLLMETRVRAAKRIH